jgi:GxxExxY protein
VVREVPIELVYRGSSVGLYRADMSAGRVLVEVKSTRKIIDADERQLQNYLKGSKIRVGLLFNFGPKPEFRRRVF